MVTPDEQRALQMENAKADEKLWTFFKENSAEQIEGHKDLIQSAEKTIASNQATLKDAGTHLEKTKYRIAKIERGETVEGGFEKPVDVEKILRDGGWKDSNFKRARLLTAIIEAGGEAAFEELMEENAHRRNISEGAAIRAIARRCGRKLSLYCFSPEERAPVPIQRR